MAKRSPMSSLQASRTLVKSPPELWAELSDLGSLARHLGEFGEIRITKVDPESRVEWEADRASGTVRLEPSGWGTRVVLTVDTPEPAADPEPEPEEAPVAEAEPEAVEPEPRAGARAEEPVMEPAAAVEEPKRGFWARLFGRRKPAEPAPAPEPVAVEPEPEPEPERARARAGDRRSARSSGRSPSRSPKRSPSRSPTPPPTPARSSTACSTPSAPRTTAPSAAPNTLASSLLATITFYSFVLFVHIAAVVLAFGVTFSFPIVMSVARKATSATWASPPHAGADRQPPDRPARGLVLLAASTCIKGPYDSATLDRHTLLLLIIILGVGGGYIGVREERLADMAERDIAASPAEGRVSFGRDYERLFPRCGRDPRRSTP